MYDLFDIWDSMKEFIDKFTEEDKAIFGAIYCMILEEWCKKHHEDAVAIAKEFAEHIEAVNKELGKY